MKFIMTGAPWYGPPLYAVIFPKVRQAMMQVMNINAETARQSGERVMAALDKLDYALNGRRFLVNDRFSRADLTACALLSPLCRPTDKDVEALFPEAVLALRNQHKGRRYFGWVRNIYDNYRQPMRAETRVAA